MKILGIDPGLVNTGWGLIDASMVPGQGLGVDIRLLASGAIAPKKKAPMQNRLRYLLDGIEITYDQHKPDIVVVESTFFSRMTPTVIALAQARGAILAALGYRQTEVVEYTPSAIKNAVAGHGQATKEDLWLACRRWLGPEADKTPKTADEKDAIAIAISGYILMPNVKQ